MKRRPLWDKGAYSFSQTKKKTCTPYSCPFDITGGKEDFKRGRGEVKKLKAKSIKKEEREHQPK